MPAAHVSAIVAETASRDHADPPTSSSLPPIFRSSSGIISSKVTSSAGLSAESQKFKSSMSASSSSTDACSIGIESFTSPNCSCSSFNRSWRIPINHTSSGVYCGRSSNASQGAYQNIIDEIVGCDLTDRNGSFQLQYRQLALCMVANRWSNGLSKIKNAGVRRFSKSAWRNGVAIRW